MSSFKVGLALDCGGIKGLAHIAVIKVLEENKIPIDFIAGSSVGSLIGGLYAAKKNIKEVEELILSLDKKRMIELFFDPSITKGLVNGFKIKKFISEYIGSDNFKDLKIPFCAVSTNLKTGQPVEISTGSVSEAIMASGAVPVLFKPVIIGNQILTDGGFSLPIPVSTVKKMGADLIIASNLHSEFFVDEKENFNMYRISSNSLSIMLFRLAQENAKMADFVFQTKTLYDNLSYFMPLENKKEIIRENEEIARKSVSELKLLINKKSRKSWLLRFLNI